MYFTQDPPADSWEIKGLPEGHSVCVFQQAIDCYCYEVTVEVIPEDEGPPGFNMAHRVTIVGDEETSPKAMDRAIEWYRGACIAHAILTGMCPKAN